MGSKAADRYYSPLSETTVKSISREFYKRPPCTPKCSNLFTKLIGSLSDSVIPHLIKQLIRFSKCMINDGALCSFIKYLVLIGNI